MADFTPEVLLEAFRKLRRSDPAKARQAQRLLSPQLDKVFPRRLRDWTMSSAGTRARLALLSENPHFLTDVAAVRELIQIPDDELRVSTPRGYRQVFRSGTAEAHQLAETQVVLGWLQLHDDTCRGTPLESDPGNPSTGRASLADLLSSDARASAIAAAGLDFSRADTPKWLGVPTAEDRGAASHRTPFEHAVRALIARHRLPAHTFVPVISYVLTRDPIWLRELSPLSVRVTEVGEELECPDSIGVEIEGIDEFTTRTEWDHIWEMRIAPRQHERWLERGTMPSGRRSPELEPLARALTVYRTMTTGVSFARAVEKFAEEPEPVETEAIRKSVAHLKRLLAPVDA